MTAQQTHAMGIADLSIAEDTAVQRFEMLWASLSDIGRDPSSGGYRRYAWTSADLQMRAWFVHQAGQRGMRYEQDRNGNQWAWWGSPGAGAVVTAAIWTASPTAGV
jgi:N-carbamoyl-L-amino-acid hydrolase